MLYWVLLGGILDRVGGGANRKLSHLGQDRATWGFPGNQPRLQAEFLEHAQCWDISQTAVGASSPWGRETGLSLLGSCKQDRGSDTQRFPHPGSHLAHTAMVTS